MAATVSVLNLNPDRNMRTANHALSSHTCCVKGMLGFVCVCVVHNVCGEVCPLEQTVARVTRERMRL